jgi:hypothetical protein
VQELFDRGSTLGGYLIFPNNQVNRKHTIDQARGVLRLTDDRFDLTLECIRRFYVGEPSPLAEVLNRYASGFELFEMFKGYVDFFFSTTWSTSMAVSPTLPVPKMHFVPLADFQLPPT